MVLSSVPVLKYNVSFCATKITIMLYTDFSLPWALVSLIVCSKGKLSINHYKLEFYHHRWHILNSALFNQPLQVGVLSSSLRHLTIIVGTSYIYFRIQSTITSWSSSIVLGTYPVWFFIQSTIISWNHSIISVTSQLVQVDWNNKLDLFHHLWQIFHLVIISSPINHGSHPIFNQLGINH